MESIFGKLAYNKNLAIEIGKYLDALTLARAVASNKRFREIYSQDIIWWGFLYSSFPGIRFAENYLFDDGKNLNHLKAMKSYFSGKNAQLKNEYKIPDQNKFFVHIQGMIGNLPKSADIKRIYNDHTDLLAHFQNYFMFEGQLYSLTTFGFPFQKYQQKLLKKIHCFFVLGNKKDKNSIKECKVFLDFLQNQQTIQSQVLLKSMNIVLAINESEDETQKELVTSLNSSQIKNKREEEEDKQNEDNINGQVIQELQEFLIQNIPEDKIHILSIKELSNQNISLIFNHILKVSIDNLAFQKLDEEQQKVTALQQDQIVQSNNQTQQDQIIKTGKKCIIY